LLSTLLEKQDEVLRFSSILGIFPVDIDPIETKVLDKGECGGGEFCTGDSGGCREGEVRGIGPAADGEKSFETAVALLEEVELLEGTVDVVAWVVPRVGGVVFVGVGPGVCEEDLTGLRADVGE